MLFTMAILLFHIYHQLKSDFELFDNTMNKDTAETSYTTIITECFEKLGEMSKIDGLVNRREKLKADLKTGFLSKFAKRLEELFNFFEVFQSNPEKYAVAIIKAYQVVSYHNVCHGLAVGLYAAQIHAIHTMRSGQVRLPIICQAAIGSVPRTANQCARGRNRFTIVSTDFIKSKRHAEDFILKCPEFVIVDEAHGCTLTGGVGRGRSRRTEPWR